EVQPWPKFGPAMAERQISELEDPAGAVWTAGRGAIKRRIRSAGDGDPSGGQAPCLFVDIGDRGVQRLQGVIGIAGEAEQLARPRVMVLVNQGGAARHHVWVVVRHVSCVWADGC